MTADIHTHDDIFIGNLPLNHIDSDGCRWIVSDVTGWWETPPAIIPEDERPYHEDGNYWTAGRYGARTIQISGAIIPPTSSSETRAQELISNARERMNREINLVRRTGVLTFHEVDATRQIEVQLLGQPLIATSSGSNVLLFDLQFIASDPRKQSSTKRENTASMMQVGVGGRKYPRTYPRIYGASSGSNRTYVVNEGDTIAYGNMRISGPITNPRVDHVESGNFFKMNITLGPEDFIDVDMDAKTVVLNNQVSRIANLDFESTWFPFLPGDNTLLFTGTLTSSPQEGWAQATNLVTNPSVEASGGSEVVLHRNFMPDPSFKGSDTVPVVTRVNIADNPIFEPEKDTDTNLVTNPTGSNTSGTVVVRENLAVNPRMTGTVGERPNGWHGTLEGYLLEDGTAYLPNNYTNNYECAVGDTVTATLRVFPPINKPDELVCIGINDTIMGGGAFEGGAATWTPLQTVPPEGLVITVSRTITTDGYRIRSVNLCADWLMIEQGESSGPLFNGDISPDPDLTPEWTGEPGASTSRLVAPSPYGWSVHGLAYYSKSRDAIALRRTPEQSMPYIYTSISDSLESHTTLAEVETSDGEPVTFSAYRSGDSTSSELVPSGETFRRYGEAESGALVFRAREDIADRTVYLRAALVSGEYGGPYFDGDEPDTDPFEYGWVGEADDSESTRTLRTLPRNESTPTTLVESSSEWSAVGDYSLKLTPLTEDNNTFTEITPAQGFKTGQRYTISAEYFEPSELQGDLHPYARSLVLSHSEGTVYSPAPEGGGRATLLTSIPSGAQDIRLFAYNGSGINSSLGLDGVWTVNEASVHWDGLAVIEGETRPDFFYHGSSSPDATYSLEGGVSVEKKQSTPRWRATGGSTAYIDHSDTSDLVVEFVVGSEVETTVPIPVTQGAEIITVGAMITASGDTLVTPNITTEDGSTSGDEVRVPAGVETMIRTTIPVGGLDEFGVGFAYSAASSNQETLTTVRMNSVIVTEGRYEGPYFDMDEGLSGLDMQESRGVISAVARTAPGFTNSEQSVVYRSREWSREGQFSLAVQRKDEIVDVEGTYAEITSPSWSSLSSGEYTMYATVHAQPGNYLDGPQARTIEVVDLGTGDVFRSEQAAVGENTTLVLKFTKSTNEGYIRLVSNALGGEKVFWDDILIVRGEYSDRYFNGDTDEASWNGTPHASTSSQDAKVNVPAPSLFTTHRDSWIR